MSETPRTDPPLVGSETEILLGFLDYHRDTLRLKTGGLDAEQLGMILPPSTMTLGGLLNHLAFVEDWWLNQVFAGGPARPPWDAADWKADPDWEWHTAVGQPPEQLRGLYDDTVAACDRILAAAVDAPEGLDALAARRSRRDPERVFNLRWIVVHLIEEYARHNGHADLIRESIDGQVGE